MRYHDECWSRHNAILRKHLGATSGTEVKTEGDSFFVVFRKPLDALSFAVGVQRDLRSAGWPPGADVLVRIGIHTGDGTLSEGDYVGIDVHRAARVSAASHGGQVLVSAPSRVVLPRRRLPDGVTLRDLGEHNASRTFGPGPPLRPTDVDGLSPTSRRSAR